MIYRSAFIGMRLANVRVVWKFPLFTNIMYKNKITLKSHKLQNEILWREHEIKNKLIFYVFQYRPDYYNITNTLKNSQHVYTFCHNNNCFGSCIFTFHFILLLFFSYCVLYTDFLKFQILMFRYHIFEVNSRLKIRVCNRAFIFKLYKKNSSIRIYKQFSFLFVDLIKLYLVLTII